MSSSGDKAARAKWNARLPLWVGYVALAILIGGFGSWSAMAIIAGAIVAPGQIQVEQNRQIVQHLVGGLVSEIDVEEGDLVTAGQVLLRLDAKALKSELAVIEGQYFELMARRGALEAERDALDDVIFDPRVVAEAATNSDIDILMEGQRRLFLARRDNLQREIDQMQERKVQIGAQIDGQDAQLKAIQRQLDLVLAELADQENLLQKGLAQASRVSGLRREVARMEGLLGEIAASRAEASGRVIEVDIGILRLQAARREEAITRLRDLQYREFELAERRLIAQDTLEKLVIRAPLSGAVYGLQVHALNSVIQPAQALMYIVPQDRPLVISSRVSPIHIDQVHVGQEVMLRFSTFDQHETPELRGRVMKLSADAFFDEATQTSYYQAEILPYPEEYARLGDVVLLPGMPVESFIRTTDRTPLAYLVKPMADYFAKAFRED